MANALRAFVLIAGMYGLRPHGRSGLAFRLLNSARLQLVPFSPAKDPTP